MSVHDCPSGWPLRGLLMAAVLAPAIATAQAPVLDTAFGSGGITWIPAEPGWWTDWDRRDVHLTNFGVAAPTDWVVGGSFKTIANGNLYFQRSYGFFTDAHASASLSPFHWGAGQPETVGGIIVEPSGTDLTFIGTGRPGGGLRSVHMARTGTSIWDPPATSCNGGFQRHLNFGPTANDEIRGAAVRMDAGGGYWAVGASRLSNGETRGLVVAMRYDCTPDPTFGSGGAVLLDVNPFVIGPPPRRIRINAVKTFTNAAGQPRIVLAGGARWGLADSANGACFLAVMTPSGALDPTFDGDGIRLFDAVAHLSPSQPTYCDFNDVLAVNDAAGRGFITVADYTWTTNDAGGTQPLRFTSSGAPAPGFNGFNFGTSPGWGPSTLALRGDGVLLVGSTHLTYFEGGRIVAIGKVELLNPTTADFIASVPLTPLFGQDSFQVSKIVPVGTNRFYVVGTAGPGRFGHDRIYVMRYASGTRQLTVSVTGGGTVSSQPAGISNCGPSGGTCSAPFDPGTVVTLTPTSQPFHLFAGWGGGLSACATNPTCTITLNANVSGVALFLEATEVTIARSGDGVVSTTLAPGLTCGAQIGSPCTGSFVRDGSPNPVPARFTATPAQGWRFVAWGGDFASCGTNPNCDRAMTQPAFSATATFAPLAETIFANGFEP